MIKQDYTGDSNIIKRIVAILNKKAPMPLDQQGNVDWGTDGKVLGTDGVGSTKWVTASSGGGNVDDVKVNGTSVVDSDKIAQITSYREVTQAEYNALPDTKYSDGVAYFIKDDVSTDRNAYPPLIYSTQEREVGVWVDGKPLYQKSYPVTFALNTNVEIQLDISPDTLFFVTDGTFNKQTNSGNVVNYGFYYDSSDRCQMFYRASENKVVVFSVGNSIDGSGYVTLRYTKTTDTAGSGDWTTQGTHAVHYSTDEYIIGTWIDGKPLYEKTYVLNNSLTLSDSSWTAITELDDLMGVANMIVRADGMCVDSTSAQNRPLEIAVDSSQQHTMGLAMRNNEDYFTHITVRYTKTAD